MPEGIAAGPQFHEALAEGWAARYQSGSFQRRLEFLRQDFHSLRAADALWLDAGCGSGVFSRELATSGAAVVAVDASPQMLAEAARNTRDLGSVVRCLGIDTLERIPLPDEHFDGVICLSVLEYLDDPNGAIRELHRLLKPGGQLLLTVPNAASIVRLYQRCARAWGQRIGRQWHDYLAVSRHAFSRRWLVHTLQEHSLQVVRLRMFSTVCPAVLSRCRLGAMWAVTAVKV